jgi:two-component system, sensor histidine kinase RpfC
VHRSLPAGIRRWTTRAGWAQLIAAVPRMELDQAGLRLAVAIFALLAVIFELRGLDHAIREAPRALWFIVGFILFAATIVLWILSVPHTSPLRRMLGIVADNAAITFAMLGLGERGAVIFGVYLFVAFGNGFRYGRAYLYLSQVLALVGFGLVLSVSDFWAKDLFVGVGLLLILIVIPFYVGELAHKMRARHLETEQALNECLERERPKT